MSWTQICSRFLIFRSCISKNNIITSRLHMAFLDSNWKDKRVVTINRLSLKKGWSASDNNPCFEQYILLQKPNIKTKHN